MLHTRIAKLDHDSRYSVMGFRYIHAYTFVDEIHGKITIVPTLYVGMSCRNQITNPPEWKDQRAEHMEK